LFVSNAADEYYEDWHFYAYTGNSLDALVLKNPLTQDDLAGVRYRVAAGEALHFLAGAYYEPVVFNLRFIPDPPRQRLSTFRLSDGSYLLAFTDEPGQRYVLETSTDLEHWYGRGVIDSAEMPIYFRSVDLEDRTRAFFRVRRIGPVPPLE
jgi:hypothetical protein